MKKMLLVVLIVWPFIAYASAQQNQTNEILLVPSDDSQMKKIGNLTESPLLVKISNPNEILLVPSDDSQIKVIGNLTESPVLVRMSNEFYPTTFLDWILIFSGFATMGLVIILWYQTWQTEKSTRLQYGPIMHGRFTRKKGEHAKLLIDNVGFGPALDIDLKIKTSDGKRTLATVKRFAFAPRDPMHPTEVDLDENPVVLLEGTYKDVTRKIQKIHQKLEYPHMKEVKEKNDESKVDESELS